MSKMGATGKQIAPLPRMGEGKRGRVAHSHIRANGIEFDSKAEHDRYLELLCMEQAGHISGLCCHPEFQILPPQTIPGRPGFRGARYTADFAYTDRAGQRHVEDVKSAYTRQDPAYVLRRKLMYLMNGIYVEEVLRG